MKKLLLLIAYYWLFRPIAGMNSFRVMTFSTWGCGTNVDRGKEKIVEHIQRVNPDIAVLQDVVSFQCLKDLTAQLGAGWVSQSMNQPDVGIITRHTFVAGRKDEARRFLYVQIKLASGQAINFWGVHADRTNYGPEYVRNPTIMFKSVSKILQNEQIRARDMQNLLLHVNHQSNEPEVMSIIAGDFSSPSHLDWIEPLKDADFHNGFVVPWPSTKLLEDAGFFDSFRVLETHEFAMTWSPVVRTAAIRYPGMRTDETSDRIDFIFYRPGNKWKVKPVWSGRYAGTAKIEPLGRHRQNNWPSDHWAFVTDFVLLTPEGKP